MSDKKEKWCDFCGVPHKDPFSLRILLTIIIVTLTIMGLVWIWK